MYFLWCCSLIAHGGDEFLLALATYPSVVIVGLCLFDEEIVGCLVEGQRILGLPGGQKTSILEAF